MSLVRELLAPQAAEFPNRLRAPVPAPGPSLTVGRQWIVPLLLLACFLPRVYLATQIDVVCDDGAYFVACAQALDQGDLKTAFSGYKLNLYPIILVGLHRLGLDWEFAGRAWGVGIATLLVLPLFGLVRRQFDERIAVLSCLLYAAHPNLIEWSPELIRCNTFFFLAVLAAYCAWRAATEASPVWHLAAGTTAALAALTRSEGWLLFVLLLCWTGSRCRHFPHERPRQAIGLALAVGFLPALFILANLTLLAACPQWSPLRGDHLRMVAELWTRLWGSGDQAVTLWKDPRQSTRALLWIYVHKLELGVYWLQGLFLLGGIAVWRRVWLRQDQQPLFYVCALQLMVVAVFLNFTGVLNSRYFFLIPILGSPFIALGLLAGAQLAQRLARSPAGAHQWATVAAGVMLATICSVGVVDGCYNDYQVRIRSQRLGQWLGANVQPAPYTQLVVTRGCCPSVVGYYAHLGNFVELQQLEPKQGMTPEGVARVLATYRPGLVILARSEFARFEAALTQAAKAQGLQPLRGPLSADCQEFLIFAREGLSPTPPAPAPTTAAAPAAETLR